MGKVYYDMGFLATAEVVECSATELIGQYVGQTGPKTQKLLEKALGKVLFIDEAYRLAEGHFATEAMDEIVDCLTKPKFAQKLVTILAGYDDDINRLMSINPGLTSRFPEAVVFNHLSPEECLGLLIQLLQRKKHLNTTILEQASDSLRQRLVEYFEELTKLPSWGNARDIQSLVKSIFGTILSSAKTPVTELPLSEEVIFTSFEYMISERSHRGHSTRSGRHPLTTDAPQAMFDALPSRAPEFNTTALSASDTSPSHPQPRQTPEPQSRSDETPRDSGVSDAVWHRLQEDKRAAEARAREYEQLAEQEKKLKESAAVKDAQAEMELQAISQSAAADDEARRQHEEARLRQVREQRARDEELEELERKRKTAADEKRKEAQAQTKLRHMGVCPVGFRWIKQHSGYRCAGGSHFVSDAALNLD